MTITIKIPKKEVESSTDVSEVIKATLEKDKDSAYTVMGLMVSKFGVKESEIDGKPFYKWKKGLPALYTKIRVSLENLKKEEKVKSKKHGRAVVYWWVGD